LSLGRVLGRGRGGCNAKKEGKRGGGGISRHPIIVMSVRRRPSRPGEGRRGGLQKKRGGKKRENMLFYRTLWSQGREKKGKGRRRSVSARKRGKKV